MNTLALVNFFGPTTHPYDYDRYEPGDSEFFTIFKKFKKTRFDYILSHTYDGIYLNYAPLRGPFADFFPFTLVMHSRKSKQ